MKLKDRTDTHQFDWSFYTHDAGAATAAAKDIVNGKTIKFALFDRDKNDSTHMIYKGHCYIGLVDFSHEGEGAGLALRYSSGNDLQAGGSHSLIASWNPDAGDVVLIAATIAIRLRFEATDFFIDNEIFAKDSTGKKVSVIGDITDSKNTVEIEYADGHKEQRFVEQLQF